MTVALTVLGFLLAMALGSADRHGAALRAVRRCAGLATLYVEFFRGIPVLLLLFFLYYSLPEVGHDLGLPFSLKLDAFAGRRARLRPELRRLRGGNLSGRHRLDSRRPMGGGGLAGHVAAARSSAASSCRRRSASSSRP